MARGQRRRIVLGIALGLAVTGAVAALTAAPGTAAWLCASMGASAVLVFALPSSPLSQPWAVVVGHAAAATAGVATVHLGAHMPLPTMLAPAIATALAALLMLLGRCLHAPGGGTAIVPVLAGTTDFGFVLQPVVANAVVLVASAWSFHRLVGQHYPHAARAVPDAGPQRFATADVDALLERHGDWIDLPRDELLRLLDEADAVRRTRRDR